MICTICRGPLPCERCEPWRKALAGPQPSYERDRAEIEAKLFAHFNNSFMFAKMYYRSTYKEEFQFHEGVKTGIAMAYADLFGGTMKQAYDAMNERAIKEDKLP